MTNESDDAFDPFGEMFPAEEEKDTSPGARRAAFRQDPHGTIDRASMLETHLMISA